MHTNYAEDNLIRSGIVTMMLKSTNVYCKLFMGQVYCHVAWFPTSTYTMNISIKPNLIFFY